MNVLFIITCSLFFLWIVRDIFFWVTLWQENEYRFDRFFASLKRKKLKKELLLRPVALPKWILFFAFGLIIVNDSYLLIYQYCIAGLYMIQLLLIGQELYRNKVRKPLLRPMALLLLSLSFMTVLLFFTVPLVDKFFWLLLLDLLVPVIIATYVLIFSFPVEIYLDWQLDKALKKLQRNPELLVIAVTGSTGKSLMTDYIATILRQKFKVVRTHRANNTYEEISRTILSRLQSDTEIFVAEIKAYRRGEIRALCEIIKPQIGVLTPINSHYLTLFKTLDNIKKTNNELIESLPKKGYCLFNGNNKNTYSLYKASKKPKHIYSNLDLPKATAAMPNDGISVSHITHTAKRTSFTVTIEGKAMHCIIPTNHSVEYLLPGIYIANALGMREEEIKKALRKIK